MKLGGEDWTTDKDNSTNRQPKSLTKMGLGWSAFLYGGASIGAGLLGLMLLVRVKKSWTVWGSFSSKQSLQGKIYIITGANTGIGYEVAKDLAAKQASVVLACRDVDRANQARDRLRKATGNANIQVEQLDLSSLKSVQDFAKSINGVYDKVDGLVCNAGVWIAMKEGKKTKEGHEIHFGVNHLGHFLLTQMLEDRLSASESGRVVIVSSELMNQGQINTADPDEFIARGRTSSKPNHVPTGYADSKLFNGLMCRELAKRLPPNVSTYVTSPGFCYTELFRYSNMSFMKIIAFLPIMTMFMRSAARGSQNILFCLLAAREGGSEGGLLKSGDFYRECGWAQAENKKLDGLKKEGEELWNISRGLVKEYEK